MHINVSVSILYIYCDVKIGCSAELYHFFDTGDEKVGYGEHIVRLLTYLPEVVFYKVPYRPKLLYDAGRYLGNMANVMEVNCFNNDVS